jgi:long-chain acyl-CoA synthetase
MSALTNVLRQPEARQAGGAILRQIGLGNTLSTIGRLVWRMGLRRDDMPRQFLLNFWETLGEREAIIDGDRRISFGQFRERVLGLTSGLHRLGVGEDAACAELLYNGSTWFELMMANSMLGAPMPMLNWHLQKEEVVACVNRAAPRVLVFDSEFLDTIRSVRDQFETVEHLVVVGAPAESGITPYESLIEKSATQLPPGSFNLAPKPYSGGTTGTPKYINMDHSAMMGESDTARRGATREQVVQLLLKQASMLYWYGLGELHDPQTHNVRSLIPGPLYHAGVQVGVMPFFFGGTVVPMRRFSPEGVLALIERERINWTFVAPTMLERILALPEELKARYDLGTMHTIICAAAPCPPRVKREINALFRRQGASRDVFHEYYGASETGLITILVPEDYGDHEGRYESVGKIRAAHCRIYDPDTRQWAPTGQRGKVLVRSAMTFGLEYVGQKDKTDECFIEIDGENWYDDGLIGYVDEDEFLYLTSRVKEMIISGGVNLFPNEIEHVIKQHPLVLDVAVVRAPDPDLGEVPAAVVELRDGAEVTEEELLQFCKDNGLYGFKLPRIIDFVDHLPRNLAGKLPKKELEARYWQAVAQHA